MNKIKDLRKRQGLSQKDLADMLGVSQNAVSQYESGKRVPSLDMLVKIANILSVSADYLLERGTTNEQPFGRQIKEVPKVDITEDTMMIPLVASLRCGYDYQGVPYEIIKPVQVPSAYAKKWGKNIVAMKAVGNSMSPTIVQGDMIICKPGDGWEDGNIVVFSVNDSDTIKRIRHSNDGGIDLIPDNPSFQTMHYTPEELDIYQAKVLGRVLKALSPDL